MRVLYLHLPRFPVQRRVLEAPSLERQAFVLVEEVRGQRRVAFASTAAMRAGVASRQTLTAASALVPGLPHFSFNAEAEARVLIGLGEALMVVAPAFQLSAPDGLWLDAGAAHLCGGEEGLVVQALRLVEEQGYRARAVVASQLFTARALTRHGRGATAVVEPGGEAALLDPLPLAALEVEDGNLVDRLAALGLKTLGQVAALPEDAVVSRFGSSGLHLYRRARGQDEEPFVPTRVEVGLEESLELGFPAESMEPVLFGLKTVLDRLCARLNGRKQALARLRLRLRLDPGGEQMLTLALARPTTQVRLLLDLTRLRLEVLSLPNPVAGIVATVEEAAMVVERQLLLGDEPEGDAPLEVVLSRLATSMGEDSLQSLHLPERYRPERASALRPFRPPRRRSGFDVQPGSGAASKPLHRERPARLLVAPEPVHVQLGEEGQLLGATVLGRRRRVLAVAGPESIRSEWWSPESAFARDYYRVLFDGVGPVWLYRDLGDGRFYLAGLFD